MSFQHYTDFILTHIIANKLLVFFLFTGLLKVQSLIRATNETSEMSVIVRQADLRNMRAVLKEAKKKHWRHIIAELNITETTVFLKMVSIYPFLHLQYLHTFCKNSLFQIEEK